MSLNRYAKRRDKTEKPLIKELRQCGFQVRQQDFPDLAVRRLTWPAGMVRLLEVNGVTRYRKRSQKQLDFLKNWQIPIVTSLEDALSVLGCVSPPTSVTCTSKLTSAPSASVAGR